MFTYLLPHIVRKLKLSKLRKSSLSFTFFNDLLLVPRVTKSFNANEHLELFWQVAFRYLQSTSLNASEVDFGIMMNNSSFTTLV